MPSTGLHRLSFVVARCHSEGWLVFGCGSTVHGGNLVVAGAFSFHVAVVVEANGAPVLRRLGEGWQKLPPPLDAVRNSSAESSIVAHCGVDPPL
jgi:hypothetical protein